MGATMISIHSPEENYFIQSITSSKSYYWLGAVRKELGRSKFVWKDGSKFNYTSWWGMEPDQINQDLAKCVTYYNDAYGKWSDDFCHLRTFQICQKNVSKSFDQIIEQKINLLFINLTNTFEKSINSTKVEFDNQILMMSSKLNGVLKLLNNVITQISEELNEDFADDVVVSDRRTQNNDTKFTSKSLRIIKEFDITNFRNCVVKYIDDENVTTCYYYYNKDAKTFEEANEVCKSSHSHMLAINDKNENDHIKTFLHQDYWIGGIRIISRKNYFTWINGEPFEFTNWDATEPKMNYTENCVSYKNRKWFANNCNEKMSFICEEYFPENYLKKKIGSSLINNLTFAMNVVEMKINEIEDVLENNKQLSSRLSKFLSQIIDDNAALFRGNELSN
ncbi:membrane-bound C-type lectin-like protein, partial [Leptotrombidium deliense]